jgi:mono/diheme cytochrome c family protein
MTMKHFGLFATALLALSASRTWAEEAPPLYKQKCELCHSIAGVGGKKKEVGGPLDGVGSKRDDAWLRAYIADPKSRMDDAKMPKFKLAPPDMDAMVKYMLSLK